MWDKLVHSAETVREVASSWITGGKAIRQFRGKLELKPESR